LKQLVSCLQAAIVAALPESHKISTMEFAARALPLSAGCLRGNDEACTNSIENSYNKTI